MLNIQVLQRFLYKNIDINIPYIYTMNIVKYGLLSGG